jgi:hypothetical protein
MNTTFAPHLFVKNISKNISKQMLWNVFNNYGFGVIENIFITPKNEKNNAVVIYEKWNVGETISTRMLLESGKSLTIICEEWNEVWKVNAYNKNMERFDHLFVDSKLHPNITNNRKERLKNIRIQNLYK